MIKLAKLLIDGKPSLCLIEDDQYLPLHDIDTNIDTDLSGFLNSQDWDQIKAAGKKAHFWKPLEDCTWLPPLSPLSRIFCVGKNYRDHAKEMGMSEDRLNDKRPVAPDIFIRFPSSFSGHQSEIYFPSNENTFDYEGELAVVIGRAGKNINEADVKNYIFGYTTANDGTIRRVQKQTSQFTLGKNFDRSGAMGPTIVHQSDFALQPSPALVTKVNDEEQQNGMISEMIFSIKETVSILSQVTALQPGDIILTGTPAGVGAGKTPPKFLKDDDRITIQISGLDQLEVTVKST
jgi:2-keto-4-pentenoate hydratase/2-oxohepta-3-ene-1,7-dioic acid hydratase in catechol pathway